MRIPEPERRVDDYPHQFSGGMRQRVMIAMALACSPRLLIADEPTTALDVTIQAQILDLLRQLQAEVGMSILMITHDLGIVAEMADDVAVMYASKVVERAPVAELFARPLHPYTVGLFQSRPEPGKPKTERLTTIPGMVPSPLRFPAGCKFHPALPVRPRRFAAPRSRSCWRSRRAIWPAAILPASSIFRKTPPPTTGDRNAAPVTAAPNAAGRLGNEHGSATIARQHATGRRPTPEEIFSRPPRACCRARWPTSRRSTTFRFDRRGRNAGPGRRIGLRQNDRRPHAAAAGRADRRQDAASTAATWRRSTAANCASLRRNLQIVFQDPFSSLNPRMTIQAIVEEGLIVHRHGQSRPSGWKKCRRRCEQVGLDPSYINRYPHEFSGGQRQRREHRPGAGGRSAVHRARRADLGPRRFDPIADHQSAGRSEAAAVS